MDKKKVIDRAPLRSEPAAPSTNIGGLTMAMSTIRQFKEATGKVVERMESHEERGELGVVGATIFVRFSDKTEMNIFEA